MDYSQNTILDDLSACVGFTATSILSAIYGGRSLYVPQEVTPGHTIGKLIGDSAFRALVNDFGGTLIRFVPRNAVYRQFERWQKVRELVLAGISTDEIAIEVNLSDRQVCFIRRKLEGVGLLPMILNGKIDEDGPQDAN